MFSYTKELSLFLDLLCIHWQCVVLCFEHELCYFVDLRICAIHWVDLDINEQQVEHMRTE